MIPCSIFSSSGSMGELLPAALCCPSKSARRFVCCCFVETERGVCWCMCVHVLVISHLISDWGAWFQRESCTQLSWGGHSRTCGYDFGSFLYIKRMLPRYNHIHVTPARILRSRNIWGLKLSQSSSYWEVLEIWFAPMWLETAPAALGMVHWW